MSWLELSESLIKEFEGCSLVAYHGAADRPGLYTIGFGSTGPDIGKETHWTQEQADSRLDADIAEIGKWLDAHVKTLLSNHQKAALVSFAYNLGIGSLLQSMLLRLINAGDFENAAVQFERWNHSGGIVRDGLTRRRLAEKDLFLTKEASC